MGWARFPDGGAFFRLPAFYQLLVFKFTWKEDNKDTQIRQDVFFLRYGNDEVNDAIYVCTFVFWKTGDAAAAGADGSSGAGVQAAV
ncbi:MAG: hypothetical protein LUE63_05785 [Lachnospiraceae bacterium]|nr:hypothetical protein [Lachnospiraceae bacterium]